MITVELTQEELDDFVGVLQYIEEGWASGYGRTTRRFIKDKYPEVLKLQFMGQIVRMTEIGREEFRETALGQVLTRLEKK